MNAIYVIDQTLFIAFLMAVKQLTVLNKRKTHDKTIKSLF